MKYPLIVIFMGFIFVYSALDEMAPSRNFSELENRSLQKFPQFSLSALLKNEYTPIFEKYVNDQFILRDFWIGTKSRIEWLLTKVENNEILYGDDNQLFAKMFVLPGETIDNNISALQKFAEKYKQKATLMLVPTAGNIMREKLPVAAPMVDENKIMDNVFSAAQGMNIIDVREAFTAHKDEYIYYRNDHHWTTNGAYTAYLDYVKANSLIAFDIRSHKLIEVSGFLGTGYARSKYFAAEADILCYYELQNTVMIEGEKKPLYDISKLDTADKYAVFLWGNPGFLSVSGNGSGRCLVIKDSYANAFIPFLTENYDTIDVVDYRFYNIGTQKLIEDGNYSDILILYNTSTFAASANFAKILL